uniref:Zinc finger protein 703 n=1 Tax=Bos mutus grunniens TaxID=30521 RepID=A0A8B9YE11_BOSMU
GGVTAPPPAPTPEKSPSTGVAFGGRLPRPVPQGLRRPPGPGAARDPTTTDAQCKRSCAQPPPLAAGLPEALLSHLTHPAPQVTPPPRLLRGSLVSPPSPSPCRCLPQLDAKKSPLALLAQTCSQIGKPDPPPSSKLNSVAAANGLGAEKDPGRSASGAASASAALKQLGDSPAEDKSSFKPYSKGSGGGDSRKDSGSSSVSSSSSSSSSLSPGDKAGFRVPSAACTPFPPHGAPVSASSSSSSPGGSRGGSPHHSDCKTGASGELDKKDQESKPSPEPAAVSRSSSGDPGPHGGGGGGEPGASGRKSEPPSALVGAGHVAPVSPYKPGHSVFPLPPSSIGYHGSIVGAYAGYPSQFVPGLDPSKSGLVGGQLSGGLGLPPGKPPSSSPLTGASPPSFLQGLCRDPYCLGGYHGASHLGGSGCSTCSAHDPAGPGLKAGGYPLVYPGHPLQPAALSSSAAQAALPGHPLYTYGFMLQNEPLPHSCNWVAASGPCDKRFATSEELLSHLRTHTALPGAEKLLATYPGASGLGSAAAAAAAAASCHLHLPPPAAPGSPGSLSLRSPHTLGLSRYHPYGKSHLSTAGGLAVPSLPTAGPYYSPYALYGQRLASASALGSQAHFKGLDITWGRGGESVCKRTFPLDKGLDSRLKGRRRDPRSGAQRLRSTVPGPRGPAKTTCLWRHLVAERRATGARRKLAFRASHSKNEDFLSLAVPFMHLEVQGRVHAPAAKGAAHSLGTP